MAHWKDAVVTDDGVELLNEWRAGRKITVVAACGGTGTVPPERLTEQTELVDTRQELTLMGEEEAADGRTVLVQVSNANLTAEYELNQVGVYAALDVEKNPDTERKLLFIMQDEKGVDVPAASEASFLLELYCAIGITNDGRFEVSISDAGVVTIAYLNRELTRAFSLHTADRTAHGGMVDRLRAIEAALNGEATIYQDGGPTVETVGAKGQHYIDRETGEEWVCTAVTENGFIWEEADDSTSIREQMAQVSAGSDNVEAAVAAIDARLALLELMYATDVSGNPFTVTFESLTGLTCTGVWNAALGRLEF